MGEKTMILYWPDYRTGRQRNFLSCMRMFQNGLPVRAFWERCRDGVGSFLAIQRFCALVGAHTNNRRYDVILQYLLQND